MSQLTTIEGVFRAGRIELSETPVGIEKARVIVTFVDDAPTGEPPKYLRYGEFSGPIATNEEDFKLAEWRGDPEFDDDE